jgi:hypothetical protein
MNVDELRNLKIQKNALFSGRFLRLDFPAPLSILRVTRRARELFFCLVKTFHPVDRSTVITSCQIELCKTQVFTGSK